MTYTEDDVRRLGDTLSSLALDPGQSHALRALISFATRYPTDLDGLGSLREPGVLSQVLHRVMFDQSTPR